MCILTGMFQTQNGKMKKRHYKKETLWDMVSVLRVNSQNYWELTIADSVIF